MFVYVPHKRSTHTMFVCPAGDSRLKGEMPADWVDDSNKPITFQVEFKHGKGEVEDKLGEYMIKYGLARKTKIILPQDED